MNHTLEIVAVKSLSDGHTALQVRCCGSDSTLSWLTMAPSVAADNAACQESIDFHSQRVANLHECAVQALAKLSGWTGTTKNINVSATGTSHAVKIARHRQVSDGQFGVELHCCDSDQRSVHHIDAAVVIDDNEFDSEITKHSERLAEKHEALLRAENGLKTLVGTTREIILSAPVSAPVTVPSGAGTLTSVAAAA